MAPIVHRGPNDERDCMAFGWIGATMACPSSDDLRHVACFQKGGSGSSVTTSATRIAASFRLSVTFLLLTAGAYHNLAESWLSLRSGVGRPDLGAGTRSIRPVPQVVRERPVVARSGRPLSTKPDTEKRSPSTLSLRRAHLTSIGFADLRSPGAVRALRGDAKGDARRF